MPSAQQPAALVWMRDRSPGARPALSEDRIVQAAVALADAEGIEKVTMRRVATELGSGTTTLYRHITGKDELVELMVDAVQGEQPPSAGPAEDWRRGLTDVADALRTSLLRHPWLAQQAARRPSLGPNSLARQDHALGVAELLTPDPTRAGLVVAAVTTYVLGAVTAELADAEAQRATGLTEDAWRAAVSAYVRQVVESGRHPHFNRRVVEADDPDADERFRFGLECLLDGVAARAAR